MSYQIWLGIVPIPRKHALDDLHRHRFLAEMKTLLEREGQIVLELQRYNTKVFAQVLNVRLAEGGAFLRRQLPTQRTQGLNQLVIAEVPV